MGLRARTARALYAFADWLSRDAAQVALCPPLQATPDAALKKA